MSADDTDLTQGPVWRALARLSGPMVIGILAVLSVGLADAYFLGKLGGAPLAAVGFIYPITAAITSLSIGLSAGANATVSQTLGSDDTDRDPTRIGLHTVGLGLIMSLFIAGAFYLTYPYLFAALGAQDDVQTEIAAFMPYWCLSFPPLVITMQINALIRAHGSSVAPAVLMSAEAVLNIILTPLFVFTFDMGTAGAALGTFVARMVICAVAIAYAGRQNILIWCENVTQDLMWSTKELFRVGGPAAFSNAINPAGMAAVTAAVATVGTDAVGGFGAATRVQQIALVPMLALSSGIGPVVGQNWGAGQKDRAAKGLQAALAFCIAYGVLVGLILFVFAQPFASWLTSGGGAADYAVTYMKIVGWSLFGYGFVVVINAAMNARSKAGWSMTLSLGRIFALYLPLAWLGVSVLDFTGITLAAVTANVAAAAVGLVFAWKVGLFRAGHLRATFV
ncbi:putative efflux protein, MATE family [Loktanella sp. DSM 29012]|uniref:MATE family efflux transporter n=1 Tax=Loktanella sp. DSM 29012 TaxID=1881056 RepID=UPI0008C85594|nr:MATE family efflux transporter [Loktanella sp. DSM 29012]SEQ28663.1 putative efflux protein, MATE family [Loktanella sp. DSM 29012]